MNPERIGDYEVIQGPFHGNYGHVSVVRHTTIKDWTRAIKRLHPFVRSDVIIEEAKKQQAIKSPYVVQIIDFFTNPEAILMEYCPIGLDEYLRDRFRQSGRELPYDEARDVLHGILQGLNDAHNADVIHGDIKPANVRFSKDMLPKLLDFGAARRLRETSPVIRGSTNWAAPEVLAGKDSTKESDYFSFGILAYLILSGRHPFYADDPSCLTSEADNIRSATFRPGPLSSLRPDLSPRVADLVMELLSREEEARRSAEAALKAALSEPWVAEEEAPVSVVAPPILSSEEIDRLEQAYSEARRQFFSYYRPIDALNTLSDFLNGFQWQRFRGSNLSKLADCWSLQAYINNSGGFFGNAVEAATNGLTVDPRHVNSLHARGYAYIQLGDDEQAERDLLSAIAISQDPRKRTQMRKLLAALQGRQSEPAPVSRTPRL